MSLAYMETDPAKMVEELEVRVTSCFAESDRLREELRSQRTATEAELELLAAQYDELSNSKLMTLQLHFEETNEEKKALEAKVQKAVADAKAETSKALAGVHEQMVSFLSAAPT